MAIFFFERNFQNKFKLMLYIFRARSDPTIHMNAMFASTDIYYQTNNHQQLPSVSTAQNSLQWNNLSFDYRTPTDVSCVPASFSTSFAQYPGEQVPLYSSLIPQSDFSFRMQQQQQQQMLQFQNQNIIQQQLSSLQLQHLQSLNAQQNSPNSQNNDAPVGSLSNMNSPLSNQNYNDCTPLTTTNQMINMSVNNTLNNKSPASVPVTYNTNVNYQQLRNSRVQSGVQFQQQSFNNQQLGTADINSSQSAPTSPAQGGIEAPIRQQWPPTRHYSTSPDTLDIPNIVLTGTDGTLDCFQDLQDLHLDNEIQQLLNNPNSNEQMDPALETQLLN